MLGPGTLARLLQHAWPGNVRELASVLETALVEGTNGVYPSRTISICRWRRRHSHPSTYDPSPAEAGNLSLDAIIRQHVRYVLDLNRGNKLRAARQLRISRSTLYRILGNEAILVP